MIKSVTCLNRLLAGAGALFVGLTAAATILHAEETVDRALLSSAAVDGYNVNIQARMGTLDGIGNGMMVASISGPIPHFDSFGFQADFAVGVYDGNNISMSEAAAAHLFWRQPEIGMVGIYADFARLDPLHYGRLGFEGALYHGQWSIDALLGMEFGQNVKTRFFDEIDISYHFNEKFKASIGHRIISRGHVVNAGFEKQFSQHYGGIWSFFAEAEAGEDHFYRASAGLKVAFGTGSASTLMQRDRHSGVMVRIPRNLASITQCGRVDVPFRDPQWLYDLGLVSRLNSTTCGSKSYINGLSSTGIFDQ